MIGGDGIVVVMMIITRLVFLLSFIVETSFIIVPALVHSRQMSGSFR